MSVGDDQRDPGVAWISLAYHQYRSLSCGRVTVETFVSPNSDRLPLRSLSRKTSHYNSRVHGGGGGGGGGDERRFFRIRRVHGDLVVS